MTIAIFIAFVVFVVGLSFYLGSRTKSASAYYAAGGQIHWGVNGIAFAGDYLSAASFLGICGMIATAGYDGFLYSIGYLAGWIVALFVMAEPMKRLGKYTFTDALDSKFNSRAIKLTAAISTLVVSVLYLIPQMVGAGVLVQPLLNLPHWAGVIMVGAIVITIVATAGMASTTYVQFLKGAMLIVFSLVVVIALLYRGFSTQPDQGGRVPFHAVKVIAAAEAGGKLLPADATYALQEVQTYKGLEFARLTKDGQENWWMVQRTDGKVELKEIQSVTTKADGTTLINGAPPSETNQQPRQAGSIEKLRGETNVDTGSVGPFEFLSAIGDEKTRVSIWKSAKITDSNKDAVTVYYPVSTPGNRIMRPGLKLKMDGSLLERLDFMSLMLALFLGTAALPHILIRYYTVPSPAAARKSTIVAIAAIGFFYVLTLYMGLGAMVSATVNPVSDNMSAPLLARSFGQILFAIISAIAFATVLGTVSGLIVAASGAVAHDLLDRYAQLGFNDKQKVKAGKIAAVVVGIIAIALGIMFKGMNVSFLVGLAFAVAASANLPAMVMLLFWKKTTAKGIAVSIVIGIVSSVTLILLSPDMFGRYGMDPDTAPFPLSNPGIVSIPLSFIALVVASLLTQEPQKTPAEEAVATA